MWRIQVQNLGGDMTTKRFIILSAVFCVLAIVFFVLFELNVIGNLTLYLALVYISYFAGLALYYNSVNLRYASKITSANITLIISLIIIVASIALMIYGFVTGDIELWWNVQKSAYLYEFSLKSLQQTSNNLLSIMFSTDICQWLIIFN